MSGKYIKDLQLNTNPQLSGYTIYEDNISTYKSPISSLKNTIGSGFLYLTGGTITGNINLNGDVTITNIPSGTSETKILVADINNNIKYRTGLSLSLLSGTTNNGLLTLNGASPDVTVESNLTFDGSTLKISGNTSSTTMFDVIGSQGELFTINDSLSDELFKISDVSGIPVLTVGSDHGVKISNGIKIGDATPIASISNQGTLRYRVNGNTSYCEMSMQTGSTSYGWVIIKSNTW